MTVTVKAGTVYVDVVADTDKFAKSATSSFTSVAKKAAAVFGLAFAASKVIDFFGDSVHAAEESEASIRSLQAALDSMGRAIPIEQLTESATALQALTGISDEAILGGTELLATFRNISDELLNELTPALVDFATRFTSGNIDSAAKIMGKALNDPVAGLTSLSRAGVQFSEDQKAVIAALVEGGDVAAAQGVIMEELHQQIDGAAAASATGSALMKAKWDEFQEFVGGKLAGAFTIILSFLGWITDNMATVTTLVVGFGIAWAATNYQIIAVRLLEIAGSLGRVVVALGPFALAAAAVGLVVQTLSNIIRDNAEAVEEWSTSVLEGSVSVRELVAAANANLTTSITGARLRGDQIVLDTLSKSLDDLATKLQAMPDVMSDVQRAEIDQAAAAGDTETRIRLLNEAYGRYVATLGDSTTHLNKAGKAVRNFAGMTNDAWQTFKTTVAESTQSAMGSIDDFKSHFWTSVHSVIRGLNAQTERLKRWATDVAVVTASGLSERAKARLLEQPAEVVDAWVHGTRDQKREILSQLSAQADYIRRTERDVNGLNIDEGLSKLTDFNAELEWLRRSSQTPVEVSVNMTATPSFPGGADGNVATPYPLAAGGIVTRPTLALIGESGPEAVVPLSRGTRNGRTTVDVTLDRRRFSRSMDYARFAGR